MRFNQIKEQIIFWLKLLTCLFIDKILKLNMVAQKAGF